MPLRITLVTAPVDLETRYGRFSGASNTEPSFALVLLAAVARRAGHEVQCLDASACNLSATETADRIDSFAPHLVGISATTVGIHAAGELAAILQARHPERPVIAGGCHATALPSETLKAFPPINLLVMGEGEATFAELLTALESTGTLPDTLAGTAVRRGPDIHINPPRELIHDLDSLPLPAWELLDGFPTRFHPSPARVLRWPCASVVLTRGCPNQCTFCDRSVFGNRCRSYSPDYAVRLFKDLRTRFGVREILVEDDTFVLQRRHVEAFCRELIDQRVDVTWSCLGRADRVTPDLLRLMRQAGCWHLSFGIESGDPGILKSVCKNLDLTQIRNAVQWCRDAGMVTKGFFIVGFPGETHETLEATRRVAMNLPLDDISIMQMTPFPGSALYHTAARTGTFNSDWRKMNALNTVYVPTGLTLDDLESARSRILRSFYTRPSILLRHAARALRHPRMGWGYLKGGMALLRIFQAPKTTSPGSPESV
ncbi:MAG: hypothetical protein A2498_07655 [Lentisphaerae bacterium RIFOXYC12_FULL_60_16]|nr:MAG: hypothetical protein A2498_07655 [Lentisphaerae bacterium RIFOXYC12_FULL_60_16]OGV83534.1 MAG: hypothetical protein A2340_10505 [Lentisphaerae bacterium RIFOXYB12_FULL_60_10]